MNRHERRRAVRLTRDRIIRLTLYPPRDWRELVGLGQVHAEGFTAALCAMDTPQPPICGACTGEVRRAALWSLLECDDRIAVSAICADCATRGDLARAILTMAGVQWVSFASFEVGHA